MKIRGMKIQHLMILAAAGISSSVAAGYRTKSIRKKARSQGAHVPRGPYEAVLKRPLDVLAGVLALVVFSPVFVVTAVLVRVKLGRPVFFIQQRPGLDGKIFHMKRHRKGWRYF